MPTQLPKFDGFYEKGQIRDFFIVSNDLGLFIFSVFSI